AHTTSEDTSGTPGRSQLTVRVWSNEASPAVTGIVTCPSGSPDTVTVVDCPGNTTFCVACWVTGSVTTNVTGSSPPVLASVTTTVPSPSAHSTFDDTSGCPGASQVTVMVWW